MNILENIPMWAKAATAIISLIVAVGGVVVAAEDRYVDQKEITQTLEQLQKQNDIQFKMIRYDFMEERYWKLKQYVRENPNNIDAKLELQELEVQRNQMKKELGLQ